MTTLHGMRFLTEDRPENRGFFSESVEVVVEVMVNRQGQINHFDDLGDDLRASSEPCEKVTNVAVVLFDRDGQVFACGEIAAAREASIALDAAHNSIFYMIPSAAALAANLAHGGPLSRSPPRACHQNG